MLIDHLARSKIKCTPKKERKKEDEDKKVPRFSAFSAAMGLRKLNGSEETMGRTKLSIENGSRHTHFTWDERIQLQYYISRGMREYSCNIITAERVTTRRNEVLRL